MTTYSRRVIHSFLWQGGAQGIGQAAAWLATIVVIKLLTPADYGLMAMANVFLGFFFFFADLGFGSATVQAKVLSREDLRRVFGVVLMTNVAGCLLGLVAAPFVADYYEEPRLALLIRILSLNFLLQSMYALPQSQVVRDMDFRLKGRIEVTATIIAAVTGLVLANAGFGVWSLVANSMVLHGVKAISYNVIRPLALIPSFSVAPIMAMARFGVLVMLGRVLYFLFSQVDIIIGGRVLGTEAIGLYGVALSLAAIPMEKVLPVITQVSFAAFAKIQNDAERVQRNLLRAVQLVSLVCFPAFLGMAAIAGDLVPVVLGERWLPLIVPFQLLSLVLPLKAVSVLFSPALFGVGRPGVYVVNIVVALVTMTVAILIGVRFGVLGICVAWLVAYPGVFALMAWRSLTALGVRHSGFLSQCAFPALASVAMGAAVLGLREALAPLGASPLRLVVLILSGVLIYGGLIALFQRRAVRELIDVVRT